MIKHIVAAALTAAIVSASAAAQTIPEELKGYSTVLVNFSDTAHECNLKDEAMFASHLQEKLAEIGITEDPQSPHHRQYRHLGQVTWSAEIAVHLADGDFVQCQVGRGQYRH
jgi:hypothetical protein